MIRDGRGAPWFCLPCDDILTNYFVCARCQLQTPVVEFGFARTLPKGHKWRWHALCKNCREAVVAERVLTCRCCGATYTKRGADLLCPACRQHTRDARPADYERHRVQAANARAESMGLPGTLTLAAWLGTLSAFDRLCAYCHERPFEALDHFVPLELGGDTSAENCVPVCTRCNSRKGALAPDACIQSRRFSVVTIERVRAYLVNGEIPSSRCCTVTRDCGPLSGCIPGSLPECMPVRLPLG
jgi:5-methylcytosine-specific restriction endonuclease McrA